ncbi:MAG: 4-alpha-glucanotransferase, partial [Candidatus Thiodiazotropha sp. (ex Cardiolucina cf. quadrata)]|nr:4-alpha-glucanotransferase [Candidatus Thiodiazotropha sp. (ex Cardiolucina cf. quadrata)]
MNEATDPQFQSTHQLLTRRRAGILLHITSLPGPAEVGDLGSNAYRFVDFLVSCGMSVWQILPIGPTMHDNSPYQSSSVYAGNPRLISLEMPLQHGWLDEMPESDGVLSESVRSYAIKLAWEGFKERANSEERDDLQRFMAEQKNWLEDYALFQALRQEEGGCWWDWPKALRDREPQAIAMARARLTESIDVIRFEQYLFYTEWM